MKKEHHFYTAAINTFMIFFIFCTALSYTEHPMGTTNGKFLVGFLIITCTIFFVDFSKYKWVIPLVAISVLYPLILMVFGIYNFNMLQSIEYLALYVFYLLLVICLSSFYENKVSTFIFIWQVSLTLVLSMLFVFYRGLSFNLSDLLKATITNQRYGTFLTNQRYGMGFLNVNTLALFSMLLILCSCYSLIKKRSRLLSIFDLVFATVLILNTESRTPIVLILVLFITALIVSIKNNLVRYRVQNLILLLQMIFACFFAKLFITENTGSSFYQQIDEFSSYRLSFSVAAVKLLKSSNSLLFGIGPINTSYITEQIFGNMSTLDNSIGYYIFTVGIIGTILVFLYLFYLFYRINLSLSKLGFCISIFYFTYSFFENTIFLPVSAVSLFCLTIIFIIVKQNYRKI